MLDYHPHLHFNYHFHKNISPAETYSTHLSIALFTNLLDFHPACRGWEEILKRSHYLRFRALWMNREAIYSHSCRVPFSYEIAKRLKMFIIIYNFGGEEKKNQFLAERLWHGMYLDVLLWITNSWVLSKWGLHLSAGLICGYPGL